MTDERITQEEVQEGLDLLHGDAVVQFEQPAKQIVKTSHGYEQVQTSGWVKFSTEFRTSMLKELKGAKLGIFMCICLHVNEKGESFPGIDTIAAETGYHRDTVIEELKELENVPGLLTVIRSPGRVNRYRPIFVARGTGNEPVGNSDPSDFPGAPVGKRSTGFGQTSRENPDSKKRESLKKNLRLSPENAIFAGVTVTEEMLDTPEKRQEEATLAFEVTFGFGQLPWNTSKEWERFARFVGDLHQKDRNAFQKYVAWRKGDGKFDAMSNKQIRQAPAQFIDTGWPTFASTQKTAPAPKPNIVRASDQKPLPVPDFVLKKNAELQARLHERLTRLVGDDPQTA
jgi:hypothetical protein